MKEKYPTQQQLNTLESVKKEMQEPRLTESVREVLRDEAATTAVDWARVLERGNHLTRWHESVQSHWQ
jgi:hypothetical protein